MQLRDYCQQDAYGLARLIKEKQLSPQQALDFALERMHEVNPSLNAIVSNCSDWAAERLREMTGDEFFYGVPILVKDLGFAMQGVRHTAGSLFCKENIPQFNSDFVNRLLALGMLPFARTNVPELGLSYVTESSFLGACHNPYDLSRSPGGSSGGSAAAVAAGVAPVATASDGGGSIRLPAACCGLFGFKPSSGLMPTGPLVGENWSGLASPHVLTRSVRDSALLFELLSTSNLTAAVKRAEHLVNENRAQPPLTIACLEGAFAAVPVAKPYADVFDQTILLLKEMGHRVEHHHLPLDLAAIGQAAMVLIAANTCAEIETQQQLIGREVRQAELEGITWEFMQRGKVLSASQLIQAKNRLYQLLRPLHQLLSKVDLIITPALAQLPLKIGSLRTDDNFDHYLQKNLEFSPFTSLFNQADLPAMTIPVGWHRNLPLSVQFAAPKGQDRRLLGFAMELQSRLPNFSLPLMELG